MKTNVTTRQKPDRMFSRRSSAIHNRWLILSLQQFNFGGGWMQLLARQETQQVTR